MQFQIWTRPVSIRGPRRSALGLCRVDPFRALFISLTAYGTSISCFCGIGCRVVYSHVVAVFCVLIIVFAIAFYDFCHNASSFNLTGLPPDRHRTPTLPMSDEIRDKMCSAPLLHFRYAGSVGLDSRFTSVRRPV